MSPSVWYSVEQDIPQIDAVVGDVVLVKHRDRSELWVSHKHESFDLEEYGSSLRRYGPPDESPSPVLPSAVSYPIKARSDLAALFELICSSGGRMPKV